MTKMQLYTHKYNNFLICQVAVVVPNQERLQDALALQGEPSDWLISLPVYDFLLSSIKQKCAENSLRAFEVLYYYT